MPHSSCATISAGSVLFDTSFGLSEVAAAGSAQMADGLDSVEDAMLLFTQLGGACLLRILSLSDNEILILM